MMHVGKKGGLSFQWNYTFREIAERKGLGKKLNQDVAEIMRRHMDRYVPWDTTNETGYHLARMVQARSSEKNATVVYSMRYATAQYYGGGATETMGHVSEVWDRDTGFHDLTTSYWDRVCWTLEGDKIMGEIDKARKRRSKKK